MRIYMIWEACDGSVNWVSRFTDDPTASWNERLYNHVALPAPASSGGVAGDCCGEDLSYIDKYR